MLPIESNLRPWHTYKMHKSCTIEPSVSMSHLDELWINPHGLYVWIHKPSVRLKVNEPKMYLMNWCDSGWLSKSVRHPKSPSALAYDEMNIHVMGEYLWRANRLKLMKIVTTW